MNILRLVEPIYGSSFFLYGQDKYAKSKNWSFTLFRT